LSRLGRSLGQVIRIVDELVKQKVGFVAIKEAIRFEGKQDMQTKVMITLFGLFAEVERDLISQRTKEGLAAARAKGGVLGRPKGALGKSKLDGKEEEIRVLVEKTVSKASIAKIVGVSRTALHHFIRTRKLDPKASTPIFADVQLASFTPNCPRSDARFPLVLIAFKLRGMGIA
jgi:DNA invertase Pin-like site-specific DNA recombinase